MALYGSFLPIPDDGLFPLGETHLYERANGPGAVIVKKDSPITINAGRERVKIKVANKGDRPIQVRSVLSQPAFSELLQVGSHYHFIETNGALVFDRALAYGKRLDIPAGTAVRFEPGDSKTVTLVAIGGAKIITGGNGLATGPVDPSRAETIVQALLQRGFGHIPEPGAASLQVEEKVISRHTYLGMFGPTTGDRVRLADSDLWVEVEKDLVCSRLRQREAERSLSEIRRHITETNVNSAAARPSARVWDKLQTDPHIKLWTS